MPLIACSKTNTSSFKILTSKEDLAQSSVVAIQEPSAVMFALRNEYKDRYLVSIK